MPFYTSGSNLFGNLPLFPTLYDYPSNPITAERIEQAVQILLKVGKPIHLNGGATQAQYDRWRKALDKWAKSYIKAMECNK